MTWPRALSYVALWLLLTVHWVVNVRTPTRSEPAVGVSVARVSPLGDLSTEEVTELELESDGKRVRATRVAEGWKTLEPQGAPVSSDLLSALVSAVLDVEEIEVVQSEDVNDEEFGFVGPAARITFRRSDGSALSVSLGKENPARTAIYGRRQGASEVFLLGLNVRYYLNLAMRTAASTATR